MAEAFDRFDTDDSGYISVDNLMDVLGEDFPRQEIIDILGDAVDPDTDFEGNGGVRLSYAAFLRLWEKNHDKEVRANRLRMLGSQVNLVGSDYEDDDTLNSSFNSIDDCQEVAKARATFLMDKHRKLGAAAAASRKISIDDTIFEDSIITVTTTASPPKMMKGYSGGDDDYSMGGGIQI